MVEAEQLGRSGETRGHRKGQKPRYTLANAEATDHQGIGEAVLGKGYVVVVEVPVLSVGVLYVRLDNEQLASS
jgi:hypothetical protein